ncbi:MAG: hypothetical protein JW791_04045 [Nanoarchaeota archaeon]|nr:hypothetical protein [Nanoarchaeota archaeon]
MDSKAITPIVSIILLLMMTVFASTAAYLWMNSIQSSIQENVQSNLQESFTGQLTSFTLISTICNATSDNITLIMMNTGSVDISSGDLVVSLSSTTGSTLEIIIDSGFAGIDAGDTVSLELESDYGITESSRYTVKATVPGGTMMSDSCQGQ